MRSAACVLILFAACQSAASTEKASVEIDGSWSRVYNADRDTAYHAAVAVFDDAGYDFDSTNPLAGSFTAKSPISSGLGTAKYMIAHVVVETTPQRTTKVRLGLVRAREPLGGGRRPNNDQPVRDRGDYEAWLEKIAEELP